MATPMFTNPYGYSPGSKTYASDSYAAMTRQQWANYVSTFVPLENQLIKYATDPNVVDNAMSEASRDVNFSFDAQQGSFDRRMRAMGATLDNDQQAVRQRNTGLSRALADVNAQNVAGYTTRQRQQSILGNPAPMGGM